MREVIPSDGISSSEGCRVSEFSLSLSASNSQFNVLSMTCGCSPVMYRQCASACHCVEQRCNGKAGQLKLCGCRF